NPSNTVASTLVEKIVLSSSSLEIWMDNAKHRQQYGGVLNDLIGGFLKTGEDKRTGTKKITARNSGMSEITDSTKNDSAEIEQWVNETNAQENTAKEKKDEEKSRPQIEASE